MTDEEIAEEYVKSVIDVNAFDWKIVREIYLAFLAGLKEGRPKWRKVADGDFPKIGKPCLVYLANDYVITARLREDNVWTTNGRNAFENVIAWCEVPQYEEE